MTKITQFMLDNALEQLVKTSKVFIKINECYGYYQLTTKDNKNINSSRRTKKDLYFQIQFYLDMRKAENKFQEENRKIKKFKSKSCSECFNLKMYCPSCAKINAEREIEN